MFLGLGECSVFTRGHSGATAAAAESGGHSEGNPGGESGGHHGDGERSVAVGTGSALPGFEAVMQVTKSE